MKKAGLHLISASLLVVCMVAFAFAAGETKPVSTKVEKPSLTVKTEPGKKGAAAQQQKKAAVVKTVEPIAINPASAKQLKTLPGLTDQDVKKIMKGRPYTKKDELKWKKILTAPTYDMIQANIIAKQTEKAAKPTKSAKPAEPAKPAKPAKAAESAKPAQPAK